MEKLSKCDGASQMTAPLDRRGFLKLSGGLGLLAGAVGLTGCLGELGSTAHALTAGADGLPERPYHHTADGFRNPDGSPTHKHNLSNWFKHIWHELSREEVKIPDGHIIDQSRVSAQLASFGNGNRITWLGHSALLIRMSNTNILLDPFLSDHATPVPPFGPKRFAPPGLPTSKLPRIDMVVISHNHYDHMDSETLSSLPNRQDIPIIVPLRLKKLCQELGFRKIIELDWFDTANSGPITVTALPSVHFSGRSMSDRDETLWAGYALTDGSTRIHFSCDTAYHPLYKELGDKFGPFDYGLIPIGAYRPATEEKGSHATPEEAVRLAKELRANKLIPIHWGTIVLSQAPPFEAPERFLKAGIEAGYEQSALWKMKIGETRAL